MEILYSLAIPTFSDLKFIYFGKAYYVNREIVQLQSNLISENDPVNIITLPSIEGPINDLISYFYGKHIKISKTDAFFST